MSQCIRGLYIFWLLIMSTSILSFTSIGASKRGALDSPPMDVSLKDWLLVEDTQPSSDSSSGLLVRRITPKSVFVAPSLSGCSEGYHQDSMGRCVKLVKVNQAAQLVFLLQKLNSMYAPVNVNNNNNNKNKDNSGPFHVSLPLGTMENNTTKEKEKTSKEITTTAESPTVETLKTETSTMITPQFTATSVTTTGHDMTITTLETTTNLYGNTDLPTTEKYRVNTSNDSYPHVLIDLESNIKKQYQINYSYNNKRDSDNNNSDNNKYNNNNNNSENQDLSNKKPFVIVVANRTSYDPFSQDKMSNMESVPVVVHDTTAGKLLVTDDILDTNLSPTTAFTSNTGPMETVTENDSLTTITSTVTNEPSTVTTTAETTPYESLKCDSSDSYSPACLTIYTTTILPDEENKEDITEEEESGEGNGDDDDDDDGGGDDISEELIIFDNSNINNQFNKNVRESSRIPQPPPPAHAVQSVIPENVKVKCNYSLQGTQLNYGGFTSNNPNINCEPSVTTVRYPVRTTTSRPATASSPYFIRFPVDTLSLPSSLSSSSSSSSSTNNGYKKTSYVKFPDHSSSSSSFPSSSYGTKIWNNDGTSSSSSSTIWYPPSWFPFQSQGGWPHITNDHRNQQPHDSTSSNVYHKQYHHQHVLPHDVPTWINSYSSWSRRGLQRD